jgi:RNA recognition motif-containing protein
MTVKYPSSPIRKEEAEEVFKEFGDIKNVRPFRDTPNQRFIEYYDCRACQKAFDEMNGKLFKGGEIELKYCWDMSQK